MDMVYATIYYQGRDLITIIRTLLVFSIHPTLKQDNNQEGVAMKTIEIRVERSCLLLVHKEQKW